MTKLPQKRRLVVLLCAVGLGACALPTRAEVQYKFSGFGTLGAVKTTNDDTGFRTGVDQYEGATKRWNPGVDSKIAAQGSAVFSNGVTLTAQVLGSRRNGEEFDAGFEWAYIQYTGIDGLDLKGGRVVLPSFMVSDSRLVGYATPWLRVSPLVYAMMPLSHVDGEQATVRHAFGPVVVSGQFTYGNADGTSVVTSPVTLPGFLGGGTYYEPTITEGPTRNIHGLNIALEWGDWTFRASQVNDHVKLGVTVANPPPLVALGAGATSAGPSIIFKDKFQELGLQYDNGKVVVMAESVKRSTKDEKVQDAKAWYVAAGYRFDSIMPYVMVSQFEQTFASTGALPPKAKGLALGARYELTANSALKAEWAQYKNNSGYIFTDAVSPAVADKKINVMSVALDFVF
jgi:hypothetical protein